MKCSDTVSTLGQFSFVLLICMILAFNKFMTNLLSSQAVVQCFPAIQNFTDTNFTDALSLGHCSLDHAVSGASLAWTGHLNTGGPVHHQKVPAYFPFLLNVPCVRGIQLGPVPQVRRADPAA